VGAGAWEETSAGMRQKHTALKVSQRLPVAAGGVSDLGAL